MVFYLSFYLLIAIMIFIVIRLAVYYVFRLLGFEFWLLPDVFDKDKFLPLTSFRTAGDGWWGVAIRVLFALGTIAYVLYLRTIPGLMDDITKAAIKAHDDAKSYGIDKIAFNFTNTNSKSLTHEVFDVEVVEEREQPGQEEAQSGSAGDQGQSSAEPKRQRAADQLYSETL